MMCLCVLAERTAQKGRLSTHVCLQTGNGEVQMVGTTKQSGEFHSESEFQCNLTLRQCMFMPQMILCEACIPSSF